ncbi:lipase [Gregarina niphandrodes]|uniref:Lipase n=1 Tax=Gregarina niphandrodes TaxID=110365 RepID=A0A023BBI4_GRENI|nr:lipase [Gregarina niphandrodes]EZG79454.1 lipase [Gregarina niphandrodes]|eukprot:XP_011134431.1 lipase [Gregarina niphandrodes]
MFEGSSTVKDGSMDVNSIDTHANADDTTAEVSSTTQLNIYDESEDRLEAYLQSDIVNHIFDMMVNRISLTVFPNITLSAASTMTNLGDVLCESAAVTTSDKDICTTFTILKQQLICHAKEPVIRCDRLPPHKITPVEEDSQLDIHDLGVNITFEEGHAIDRRLFSAVDSLYQYAKSEYPCGLEIQSDDILPGWGLEAVAYLDYENLNRLRPQSVKKAPLSLLFRNDECDFVIVNRGTIFPNDWLIDFVTQLEPLEYQHANGTREALGEIVKGYSYLTTTLASRLGEVIERLTAAGKSTSVQSTPGQSTTGETGNKRPANACAGGPRSITITGHSMGGAFGAGETLLYSAKWPETKLALVGFGVPTTLDPTAARLLAERATVRSWSNEFDPVTRLTCLTEQGMPRCGPAPVPMRDYYAPLPNTITIQNYELEQAMPNLRQDSFGTLSLNLFTRQVDTDHIYFPAPIQVAQLHTCAYECWMNHRFGKDSNNASEICKMCSLI